MRRSIILICYIVASCSCFGLSNERDCAQKNDRVRNALDAVARDCMVDADCQTADILTCYCTGGARADADLSAVSDAQSELGECDDRYECANNLVCPYETTLEPACIDGRCEAVPAYACDEIDELLENAARCTSDEGCEVRSDINPCGCPSAVRVGLDETSGTGFGEEELGQGVLIARLVDKCDYTDTCAVIDCATGSSARCNDENRCELVP